MTFGEKLGGILMSGKLSVWIAAIIVLLSASVFFIPFLSMYINFLLFAALTACGAVVFSRGIDGRIRQRDKVIAELNDKLKHFSMELQVASSQISSVSEQLHINLDENNASAQQVYAKTNEMADFNNAVNNNVSKTLNSMKNVIQLLQDAKNTSEQMGRTSSSSAAAINSSLEAILEIVDTIYNIKLSFDETTEYMKKLSVTSEQIVRILDTVSNISKQTKLLSLNASIESAKAGEHGKGFSVVAGEIRKLAAESEDAVKDINMLIAAIQDEVMNVNGIVGQNAEKIDDGVMKSRNIEDSLKKISMTFSDVMDMVGKIMTIIEEEMRFANDMADNIGKVEDLIDTSEKYVEEVRESVFVQKESIQEIAEMSRRLRSASGNLETLLEQSDLGYDYADATAGRERINEAFRVIRELALDPGIISMDRSRHKSAAAELLDRYEYIEAAWSNDAKGRFVCSIPEAGIANANIREWFIKSINGEEFISKVYISAITKNPCITLSVPIRAQNGEVEGVIGIDLKL
jgi:methyl-accepting chemotaxis protein